MALTLLGMTWLSRVDATSTYLAAVAPPMVLIGAGQGLAFAPLTSFGIVGVRSEDAGAASGVVNTFHQLGMALGLALLVAVSADAGDLTARVGVALTWGAGLLAGCLVVVMAGIVPATRRSAPAPARPLATATER